MASGPVVIVLSFNKSYVEQILFMVDNTLLECNQY